MKDKIQSLESQLSSLQQKVLNLEAKLVRFEQNSKCPLSEPSRPLESSKTSQQGDSTLKSEKAPYLTENDPKRSAVLSEVRDSTSRGKDMESKSFSDASKIDFNTLSNSTGYNMPSHLEKGLKTALRFGNQPNFITSEDNFVDDVWRSPGKISEDEKIEIIQLGFQLNQKRKISLKNYYETTQEHSLFQLKGYRIKYEAIRKNKFYQQLKQ